MKKQKTILLDSGIVLTPNNTQLSKFVAPGSVNAITKPINDGVAYTLDIPQSSTQHVEMRTSATDRAVGYLIASLPMYAAFALAILLLICAGWSIPIFSISALIVFWVIFAASWFAGWVCTVFVSAEGVSLFEAVMKWWVVIREQKNRWDYYKGK